ncbi:MLO-like protein 9 [Pistacia vera]|uniref:MLO-like protein 9 n=1 Tax=Pistacia vera TaxID=55513 RepID=UPI001263C4AF|nr:MLO-like protein 9 [Pistacia vera]
MGEGGGPGASRELDQTPTWAVALVCSVIVLISIILEQLIHLLGKVFQKRRKVALFEALEKIKDELMLLGFISLLLSFGQNYIAKICIPTAVADTMLPCPKGGEDRLKKVIHEYDQNRRRLLWNERRSLGGAESGELGCTPGLVPLISINGLHQLHIFIFFLAAFHVMYSAITMMLGRAKIRKWKQWEQETHTEYDHLNDPTRFRLTHETSFVRSHTNYWMQTAVSFYVVCFFRQFFMSVRRFDYLTMRHGFITVHLAPGSKFDFQKYIKRSLEDDFKVVVGISPVLWASTFIFLLLNVHGWTIVMQLFSVIPLIVILSIGAKLQGIISQMAFEIKERHAVIQGIPLVQVSDSYFWFHRPQLILDLIHFVLFMNAFEITYFLWIWYEFGLKSCFHDDFLLAIIRVVLGVAIQFLCSYSTLPLYALVTQMGSNMKRSIFDDQTSKALKQWHKKALKKNEAKSPVKKKLFGHGNSSPIAMQPLPSHANHRTGVNPDQNPNIGMDNNGDQHQHQHQHHHHHHDTWPPSQQPPDLLS